MATLTRVRTGYFLNNFTNIVTKWSSSFNKSQRALFHASLLLNGPGQEIKMPSLSPTMEEGKIVKWLKKEGDTISPGDVLCDIETDKAVVSLETEEEGILAKILVPENSSTVKVGSLIALWVAEGEDWKNVEVPSGSEVAASQSEPTSPSSSTSSSSSSSSDSESISEDAEPVVSGPPTTLIKMPSLSPTMMSGTIVKWLKKEGDTISPGDVLCDIQTDKAVMSMETEEEGILAKILVPDDSKDVTVGTLIAVMVGEGEDWKSVKITSTGSPAKKTQEPKQASGTVTTEGIPSTTLGPAVKRLVTTYELDPTLIKPTGTKNRLLKGDVLKYIEDNKLETKPQNVEKSPAAPPKPASKPASPISKKKPAVTLPPQSKYKDIELSNMRLIIAKRLVESKRQIPHSYFMTKCDVDRLFKAKTALVKEGVKVSLNDMITKAVALALQIYPRANALCVNNEVKVARDVDICIAVATDTGLLTPVIRSTNLKSVVTISEETRQLAEKAKNKKLKPEEYTGGSFTISNLGMYGITHFKAIINPPQCGILAVGTTIESLDLDLTVRKFIYFTLSFDRRALEDHEAAKFMETLKYVVENPKLILLDASSEAYESVL